MNPAATPRSSLWNKARNFFRPRREEPKTRQRLRVEALEDRLVPANIFWSANHSGAWNVAANWTDANDTHQLPTSADDVFIDSSRPLTVTLGPGSTTVHSLHAAAGDTLNLAGGSLTVLTPPNPIAAFPGVSGVVLNLAIPSIAGGTTTVPLPASPLLILANPASPPALHTAALPTPSLFAVYATGTGNAQVLVSQSDVGGTATQEGISAPSLDDGTPVGPPEPDPGAAHRPQETDQVLALAVDRLRTAPGTTNLTAPDFQAPEHVADATFMGLGQEKQWPIAEQKAAAENTPPSGVWACVGLLALMPGKNRKRPAPQRSYFQDNPGPGGRRGPGL